MKIIKRQFEMSQVSENGKVWAVVKMTFLTAEGMFKAVFRCDCSVSPWGDDPLRHAVTVCGNIAEDLAGVEDSDTVKSFAGSKVTPGEVKVIAKSENSGWLIDSLEDLRAWFTRNKPDCQILRAEAGKRPGMWIVEVHNMHDSYTPFVVWSMYADACYDGAYCTNRDQADQRYDYRVKNGI